MNIKATCSCASVEREGKNMGNSQGREDTMNVKLYKLQSSDEFPEEYALIFTLSGSPLRSCTFYYRVNPDKLALTVDDGLCDDNPVRLNMEFSAVPNEPKTRYKFGPVKFKYSPSSRYMDQMNVRCNGSKGIDVELSGPMCGNGSTVDSELRDVEIEPGKPPSAVIGNADGIRNQSKIEDGNSSFGPSQNIIIHNTGILNIVFNGGNVRGNGNGCIVTEIVSGIPPSDVIGNTDGIRNQLKIEDCNSSFGHPQNIIIHNTGILNIVFNGGNVHGNGNGCIVNRRSLATPGE